MTSVTRSTAPRHGAAVTLSGLSILGCVIVGAAGLAQLAAGPGTRFGLWPFGVGFEILRWAAYAAAIGAATSLFGALFSLAVRRRIHVALGIAGLVFGIALAYWPWALQQAFRVPPPLYDITTDTESPPAFVAGRERRQAANARLPVEYPRAFAAEQHKAYPLIQPAILPLPPAQAFEKALAAARDMGWQVHTTVPAEGRIEAIAETFWFGFQDDVVIRVTPEGNGSKVDVRSTGRIGKRDGGANANRVIEYLARLKS